MDQPIRLALDGRFGRRVVDLGDRLRRLLQGALDALPFELAVISAKGVTLAVNEPARRYVLENQGRYWVPGMRLDEVCQESPAPEVARDMLASLPAQLSGTLKDFCRTYEIQLNGQMRTKQVRLVRFRFGRQPLLVILQEDVTATAKVHREISLISERLLAVQELERRRIAMELHDSTGQHLVASSLALSRLARAQDCGGAPLTADAAAALQDATECIAEAQREIRLLSYLLHPPHLERDGFEATLRMFVSGFSRRASLICPIKVDGHIDDLDFELQRNLFRVVQEALINVHRHAGASTAAVRIARQRNKVTLEISDDGHGLALSSIDQGPGVGIPGMRDRLRRLGGRFDIVDSPTGVVVKANVPLDAAVREQPDSYAQRREPGLQ
jgi:two-component system NarL family sensor kinase